MQLIHSVSKAQHKPYTDLDECKESQHCIWFPVALNDNVGEFGCAQLFGSCLDFVIPVSVTERRRVTTFSLGAGVMTI